jgi:hypothetical protein
VGEIAAAGTSLADYTSQISCTRNGAGAESGSGTSLANITVGENDTVVCVIVNTRIQPQGKLEVRKSLTPSTDPGRFDLQIDGQVLRASAGNNDATGEQTVGAGNHMVSEQAAAGTSLSRYTSSIVCRSGNGAGAIVASSQNAGPLTVNVVQSADVVCTIANTFRFPEGHPPDCSRVTADPNTLWPPNNKFQIVTLKGASDPDGDQFMIAITGVTQDEPPGREPDARRVRSLSQVELRAERLDQGDGRVYRIAFTVTDSTGLRCSGTVKVGVPHDRRRGSTARDSGGVFDSFGSSGVTSQPAALRWSLPSAFTA